MNPGFNAALNTTVRALFLSVSLLVCVTVILFVVGRQSISKVDNLRGNIESVLSETIGLTVTLGPLKGDWPRLLPVIDFSSVVINDADDLPSVALQNVRAELDLFRSLRHFNLVWRELSVGDLALFMVQDEQGGWTLSGFESGAETDLEELLNPFLHSRLINLGRIEMEFLAHSGAVTHVEGATVRVENAQDFHRAEMSLLLSQQEAPAYFIIEGLGNPTDVESFSGRAYIKLENFDVSRSLVGVGQSIFPTLLDNLVQFRAGLNSEIWIDIQPGGSVDFEGTLELAEIPLNWIAEVPPIEDLTANLVGWYTPRADWGIQLQALDFDWSDADIEPLDVLFSKPLLTAPNHFDVSVNYVNLSLLSELVAKANIVNDKTLNLIDQMDLQGELSALTYGYNDNGYFASAHVKNVDIAPILGIPGIKGADGYVEIEGNKRLFHIDDQNGLSLFFPKVYRDYLQIQRATGTVYVENDPIASTSVVRSSVMQAALDAGEATFLFSVEQDKTLLKKPPATTLLIGASNLDASYAQQYLPYKLPQRLFNWLQQSKMQGNVNQFGLLQRFGPDTNEQRSRTTQLFFDVSQASLDFHPQWQRLHEFDGLVVVDDTLTLGQISTAKLGQVEILNADVKIGGYPKGDAKNNLFNLTAGVTSDVDGAIDVLAHSSISSQLGVLKEWEYGGQVEANLDLVVPLSRIQSIQPLVKYDVNARFSQASLSIVNTPIKIDSLSGELNFSNRIGFFSPQISGEFWGEPLQIQFLKRSGIQALDIKTAVEPKNIRQLINFPWEKVITGRIPLEGVLAFQPLGQKSSDDGFTHSQSPVTLTLLSNLSDNQLLLPEPLGKDGGDQRLLALKLHFDSGLSRLEATLGDDLVSDLRFSKDGLSRGLVSYDKVSSLPPEGKLLISSHLKTTDFDNWIPVIDMFRNGESPSTYPWQPLFNLSFDFLELSGLTFNDVTSSLVLGSDALDVSFSSDIADGKIVFSTTNNAISKLSLERLNVPSGLLDGSTELSSFDPKSLSAMDFSVSQLSFDDSPWGNIAFQIKPQDDGTLFDNIRGNFFGVDIGMPGSESETSFFWGFDGDNFSSKLSGPVSVKNIGDLFSKADLAPPIDSESGSFLLDLQWADKPWLFSNANLMGNIQVQLNNGRFYNSPAGGSAVLKLVSLVNFANWLRRLRLDFSDVIGDDLEYTILDGTINFNQGNAQFLRPLKVKMPSGRMSMAGDFNLLEETADARLVATLPVASNLPWVVALLANVPAAAGVYLTSKLVSKQVDRLSSISYRIAGPWDDLEVTVDRMFAPQLEGSADTGTP
jgi:uncharacterized protein YhdP